MVSATFLRAHAAAEQAAYAVSLTDTGGWGGAHDDAERLAAEAAEAWRPIAAAIAAGTQVDDETRQAGRQYPPHVNHPAGPTHLPWEQTIGLTDWSKGRGL